MIGRVTPNAPVIVAAKRTAISTRGRAFSAHTVDALAAPVLASLAALADDTIDDVIIGNCLGPGGNIARVAALRAGLGEIVPGVTVDRQCGSGLEAIAQAAVRIRAADAGTILAGGAESASTAPWRFWPPQAGATAVDPDSRYTRAPFAPEGFADPEMGPAADALALRLGISRERQDEWAERSFARANAAQASGRFEHEIVAVDGIDRDDRPRHRLGAAALRRLRPAFGAAGTATAGNSCGIADAAAMVSVTSERNRAERGLPGLRVLAGAVTAGSTAYPGRGASDAIDAVLRRAGARVADLGFVEITEAFASQLLAVSDAAGLDESTISREGGAIALGHPWGASGAILVVRLAAQMFDTDDARLGLAACSIGGGQGIALLLERVS